MGELGSLMAYERALGMPSQQAQRAKAERLVSAELARLSAEVKALRSAGDALREAVVNENRGLVSAIELWDEVRGKP